MLGGVVELEGFRANIGALQFGEKDLGLDIGPWSFRGRAEDAAVGPARCCYARPMRGCGDGHCSR